MTWKYDIAEDGSSMEIIDHKGNLVKTLQNDGSGFKIPDDILEVMKQEAKKNGPEAVKSGNATSDQGVSPYGWKVMTDMNSKNIKGK